MTEYIAAENVLVDSGMWGSDTQWELYLSEKTPPPDMCTTVAGVAIVATSEHDMQVVLTRDASNTSRRGKWEVLGGHIDPINDQDPNGPREDVVEALCRESLEEGGYVAETAVPFAYRRVTNPPASEYPELAYAPFYWMTTEQPRVRPTETPPPVAGTFCLWDMEELVRTGGMDASELTIVKYGLAAARRHLYGAADV